MEQIHEMDSTIEYLKKRIQKLEKENDALRYNVLVVPYSEAKKIVRESIDKLKKEGTKQFSVITLHLETRLSFPVLNKVMEELEKRGEVRDATEEFAKNGCIADNS